MQTKHIEKLEDLKNFEWEYNGKHFKIAYLKLYVQPDKSEINGLNLIQTDSMNFHGNIQAETIRRIGEKNLTELKFYGLEVVLNEKPKLTRQEQEFLKSIDMDEIYIARDEDGGIYCFLQLPKIINDYWSRNDPNGIYCFRIFENLFSFITWESGKAWSKSELMELEVVD